MAYRSLDDKRTPIEANDIPDILAEVLKLENEVIRRGESAGTTIGGKP